MTSPHGTQKSRRVCFESHDCMHTAQPTCHNQISLLHSTSISLLAPLALLSTNPPGLCEISTSTRLQDSVKNGFHGESLRELPRCLMAWCCLSAALGGQFPYCLIQSLHVTNTTFAVLGCWSWRSGSRLSREPPNSCRWNSTTSQLLQLIGIRSVRDHQHTFQVC